MALDLNRLKQKQEDNQMTGNRWKVKKAPAQNFVRVFKFTHKVTEADVKAGLFTKDKLGKTIEDFDRGLTLQYGFTEKKRPIIATKVTLARYEALKGSSNTANQKSAEEIKPSKKFFLNIVDMDEKPRKMRHWGCPSTAYNDILAVIMNPEFGEEVLGHNGRDFIITHDPSKSPAEQYKVQLRDKSKSIKMDPALDKKVVDFYSDAGLKELGLTAKVAAQPAAEPEETAEEETDPAQEEEVVEEGTDAEGLEESAGEEGEAGETEAAVEETAATEDTEDDNAEPESEPDEEPAEEPAPKKPAAKTVPLPKKKPGKK